jgi:hypothetical protein
LIILINLYTKQKKHKKWGSETNLLPLLDPTPPEFASWTEEDAKQKAKMMKRNFLKKTNTD